VDLTAFAGSSQVFVRFHYLAAGWDWWWQIDRVFIGNDSNLLPALTLLLD